jgi:dTDP-4-dehydrorhamnose reductase
MRATVAVLGSQGMLGQELVRVLANAGWEVLPLARPAFDFTREADLAAVVRQAPILINATAYTNVDGAEREPELAHLMNATQVGRLGQLAARQGAYVLHFSTDFVFPGTHGAAYCEADTPAPINTYGRSKLAGEVALRESGAQHAILRLAWTYGAGQRHFVGKLLQRASQQPVVRMVSDQVGASTWTRQVARAVPLLLAERVTGLYHCTAAGNATRYEIADFVLRYLNWPVHLLPCLTADFPAPAARPLNSRLNCDRLLARVPWRQRHWRDALAQYLDEASWQLPTRSW